MRFNQCSRIVALYNTVFPQLVAVMETVIVYYKALRSAAGILMLPVQTLTSDGAVFVGVAWAAICLLSQPEALMISSGSAVNSTLNEE